MSSQGLPFFGARFSLYPMTDRYVPVIVEAIEGLQHPPAPTATPAPTARSTPAPSALVPVPSLASPALPTIPGR